MDGFPHLDVYSRFFFSFHFLLISYETDLRIFCPFLIPPSLPLRFSINWKYIDDENVEKNRKFFNTHTRWTHRYLVYVNFVVYYCYLKCEQKLRMWIYMCRHCYWNVFFLSIFVAHQKFFNIEQIIGKRKFFIH